MKKPKQQQKAIDDDIHLLPEEEECLEQPMTAEEAFMQGIPHEQFTDGEDDTTEELTEESFNRFKDSLSMEE